MGSTQLRLSDLLGDILEPAAPSNDGEWPLPDYHAASAKCLLAVDLEKLQDLCGILESLFVCTNGLGNPQRMARDRAGCLKKLSGRSWRDILTDSGLDIATWEALRNLSDAYLTKEMDEATRRAAMVINAVAHARLEALRCMPEDTEARQRVREQRRFVLARPYLPNFIAVILSGSENSKL